MFVCVGLDNFKCVDRLKNYLIFFYFLHHGVHQHPIGKVRKKYWTPNISRSCHSGGQSQLCELAHDKLDGVGLVDNRPSTN